MLTKNFFVSTASQLTGCKIPGILKKPDGTVIEAGFDQSSYRFRPFDDYYLRLNYNSGGFVVGSGTTPPTIDDYKMEEHITSGLSNTGNTRAFYADDDGVEMVVSFVLNNTTSDDITITEVGHLATVYYYKSETATSPSSTYALVERTVLDTPVTVPAGEFRTVTYTVRLNYPW